MQFKRRKEDDLRLGIAPLIDIVFLLLIFFMVTSHFDVASGVQIRLPQVAKKLFARKKEQITLIIDKSGNVYLEGQRLDRKNLQKRLEHLVNVEGLTHLILQADKDVRHGTVVSIMDLAKIAGVQSIIIAAQWKSGKVL